jgi:hypothetical protein
MNKHAIEHVIGGEVNIEVLLGKYEDVISALRRIYGHLTVTTGGILFFDTTLKIRARDGDESSVKEYDIFKRIILQALIRAQTDSQLIDSMKWITVTMDEDKAFLEIFKICFKDQLRQTVDKGNLGYLATLLELRTVSSTI